MENLHRSRLSMHDTLSRLCGINAWPGVHRCRRESNAIYFFTLVEKQIVPSTRTFIYPWTKLLEIVSSIFTSFGSKLDAAGHLEKFFRVSSRAADRYLCRGNYQRLRWRCGDPTKDKNFGAWASSPQVSRRSVHEKGAASILERIHLRENTW